MRVIDQIEPTSAPRQQGGLTLKLRPRQSMPMIMTQQALLSSFIFSSFSSVYYYDFNCYLITAKQYLMYLGSFSFSFSGIPVR